MNGCCLCTNIRFPSATWDMPLFESANFVVIPSLGSLIEGWLMIVPKKHYLAMGALSPYLVTEMDELKQEVIDRLIPLYGDVCCFEHGPCSANHRVGCGVDHAHLHVVPIKLDLVEAASLFLPAGTKWERASFESCQRAFECRKDYLYVEQPIGIGRIAVHDNFGSQTFRKAIASQIGFKSEYNWREYPREEVIDQTIKSLANTVPAVLQH